MGNLDWTFILTVVLTGLLVVFIALILLVVIVQLFGKLMVVLNDAATTRKQREAVAPKASPTPPAVPAPQVVEVVSDGLSGDIVAAITGAISAILAEEGTGKTYVVRSIQRTRGGKSAWSAAGIMENTRPF